MKLLKPNWGQLHETGAKMGISGASCTKDINNNIHRIKFSKKFLARSRFSLQLSRNRPRGVGANKFCVNVTQICRCLLQISLCSFQNDVLPPRFQ